MQKDQVDQGLSFKKRARRRLVGAIALVLLMVVILPMMLEDREKTVQEDVEIIMSPSSDLDSSAALETESLGDIEELIIQEPTTESSSINDEVEIPEVDTKVIDPKPEKTAKIETKKPVETNKEAVKNNTSTNAGYYVQIGVFSNPGNIEKLQIKLKDLGYQSLTEKITTDTGVKTRLRTENFVDRNEAAIALQNIKDAGLAGMVVSQK
ncbi:MAG: SPOR domain-containing protein [Methylophilaceae bacterium]